MVQVSLNLYFYIKSMVKLLLDEQVEESTTADLAPIEKESVFKKLKPSKHRYSHVEL